jgi:RimJ/RimL family protein N-acetyltransferase
MPSIQAPSEPLSDDLVALRLAAERDIPEILIAHQDDPELHARLGEERPPSGAQLGRRMEHIEADLADGIALRLTILQSGSDVCRGEVIVNAFDWENARAEVEIWVAPQVRNQGIARRALRLAARWLFERCRLERIALLTEPDNEPMLRSARAAGFVEEGVLRQYVRVRGRRVDVAVLSLTPEDIR